jgi:hypothetical protein
MTSDRRSDVIFRRFRRGRNGKVYDAHKYGVKAWPIRLRGGRPKK